MIVYMIQNENYNLADIYGIYMMFRSSIRYIHIWLLYMCLKTSPRF